MCRPGIQHEPSDLGDSPAVPTLNWQPQLLAQPEPRPGHTLSEATSWLGLERAKGGGTLLLHRLHARTPSFQSRHPRAARTHRLASSPPSISAQECRGRTRPARADAVAATGLKGKCFLNEIKGGLFSRALGGALKTQPKATEIKVTFVQRGVLGGVGCGVCGCRASGLPTSEQSGGEGTGCPAAGLTHCSEPQFPPSVQWAEPELTGAQSRVPRRLLFFHLPNGPGRRAPLRPECTSGETEAQRGAAPSLQSHPGAEAVLVHPSHAFQGPRHPPYPAQTPPHFPENDRAGGGRAGQRGPQGWLWGGGTPTGSGIVPGAAIQRNTGCQALPPTIVAAAVAAAAAWPTPGGMGEESVGQRPSPSSWT